MKKVIALGFFDGVHLGHGALLKRTAQVAHFQGLTPAALTFDRHPGSAAAGGRIPLLTSTADRSALMERLYGIREVIVIPCGGGMLDTPWRDFVTGFLIGKNDVAHVVAGEDFRFGKGGQGTADKLQALCAQLGLGCDIIPKVELEGRVVSSTYIRRLVADGDMETAGRFLGHPYLVTAPVVHGRGLGGRLGFPTVNLAWPEEVLLPAHGVYAAKAWIGAEGAQSYAAVTNIGVRPTVDDSGRVSVESFLLDFDGDLYGRTVRLELYRRLRPERRFDSVEALKAAVLENVRQVRDYFGGEGR